MKKTNLNALSIAFLIFIFVFSFSFVFAKSEKADGKALSDDQRVSTSPSSFNASPQSPSATPVSNLKNGQFNIQKHSSTVANFVQALLQTADREKGIGEEVKMIAKQQEQDDATTTDAIKKIQDRNIIKTFLIGSDYKNLGALRSEMVKTRNRIKQLENLMGKAKNADNTDQIKSQIQTLTIEQTKIENFIKSQEGKFSLFGWVAKLFNK